MLFSMLSLTLLAAIFDEITVGALLQVDVINFCDAAVGTNFIGCAHYEKNSNDADMIWPPPRAAVSLHPTYFVWVVLALG
jgi:hypothetical protein